MENYFKFKTHPKSGLEKYLGIERLDEFLGTVEFVESPDFTEEYGCLDADEAFEPLWLYRATDLGLVFHSAPVGSPSHEPYGAEFIPWQHIRSISHGNHNKS